MNKCKDLIKKALNGKTPYMVASKLKVSPQAIYSWLRGDRLPHFLHLKGIADKLNISLKSLREAWEEDSLSRG